MGCEGREGLHVGGSRKLWKGSCFSWYVTAKGFRQGENIQSREVFF